MYPVANKLLLTLAAGTLFALAGAQDVKPDGALSQSMGIDQHFGKQVPLTPTFKDQFGTTVTLGDYVKDKPVVILPMFFGCNGVCRLEIEDLFKTLEKDTKLRPGREFELILLSINPTETPQIASEKMKLIAQYYNVPQHGVHGLTGSMDQIRQVTDALGFRYTFNPDTKAINHPAGLMILDKKGVIRGYIYGSEYPTDILAANVNGAAKEVQAIKKPEIILLGCVMVDPVTHKRTIVVENVMKLLGCLTLLTVVGSIFHMTRKYGPGGPRTGGKTAGV